MTHVGYLSVIINIESTLEEVQCAEQTKLKKASGVEEQ